MTETISYCGLICQSCPIYLATRETDISKKQELMLKIIRACKEHYGIEYKYEDISDCDGCTSDTGRLFVGCNDCKIRTCAVQKGIESCAHCDEYPCNELNKSFEAGSGAKERLDLIRNNIKN